MRHRRGTANRNSICGRLQGESAQLAFPTGSRGGATQACPLAYLAGVLAPYAHAYLPDPAVRAGALRSAVPARRICRCCSAWPCAFAVVASLASFGGGWIVEANPLRPVRCARADDAVRIDAALLPSLAARPARPIVSLGSGLADWTQAGSVTGKGASAASSMLLGVCDGSGLGAVRRPGAAGLI